MDYDDLVRRLRAVSTTEIMTMYDLTRESAAAIESIHVQLAAPLPAKVEALIRRVQGREDCYDEVVQMLGKLARQVAAPLPEEVEAMANEADLIGHPDIGDALRSLARQVVALNQPVLKSEWQMIVERAERAESERDALRQLLADMKPHWDAFTHRRIWTAAMAGVMASIRERIDAAQSPPPSAAAAVDREDAQRGGV